MLDGCIKLLKANRTNTSLTLSWKNIGDDGAKKIADALKENTSLTSLYLSNNNIGPVGAQYIAEALKHNTSLTQLSLRSNNIGDDGAKAIAEALKHNTSLTQLSLRYNKISADGSKALEKAIKNNEYIWYAESYNQSQEIQSLMLERRNNISHLIAKYKAGEPDMEKITKFSKQIEYFSIEYKCLTSEKLLKLKQDIVAHVRNKLVMKLPAINTDIAGYIINYLDCNTINQMNIACDDNLYERMQIKQEPELKSQQAEAEQKRIEQERQIANLLKRICAGAIASYATYKLATTCCEAYISETSAMGVSIVAGVVITYFAYTMLESNAVTAPVA
ncbi:MAG: hypothetical protein ACK5V4_06185 [Alphaproteobacteria bacterium]